MAATVDFHSQIASIMEVLANAAVAEICKLVDDGYSVIQLEVSRSHKETEILRKKIKLLELQVARYRAERLKASEGSVTGRFPVTRHLLGRQGRDPSPGTSQQTKNRYLNRGAQSPQPVQKPPPIILDQDPDQDVVTTTKTEPAEPEEQQQQGQEEEKKEGEDQKELVIVKVEGGMEMDTAHQGASSDADIIRGDSDPTTSFPTAMTEDGGQLSETEAQRRLTFPYSPKREPEKKGKFPRRCPSLAHLLMGWKENKHNGDTQKSDTVDRAAGPPFRPHSDRDVKSPKSEPEVIEIDMGQEDYCAPLSLEPRAAESPSRPHRDVNQSKPESEVIEIDSGQDVCDSAMSFEDRGDGAEGPTGSQFPALLGIPPIESTWDISTFSASSAIMKMAHLHQQRARSGDGQMDNLPVQNLVRHTPGSENKESRSQQPQLSFACTYCSRQFAHRSTLRTHMRIHTGEKPYTCQQCGKRFTRMCLLKRHQIIHTGERSYPCDFCGKLFSTSTNLKNHQMVHTGERPFQCLHCEKRFSSSTNLKRHQVVHTGEKQYQCSKCGKDFSINGNLTRHSKHCTGPSEPGTSDTATSDTVASDTATNEPGPSNTATGDTELSDPETSDADTSDTETSDPWPSDTATTDIASSELRPKKFSWDITTRSLSLRSMLTNNIAPSDLGTREKWTQ